jgi:hypothetical protein
VVVAAAAAAEVPDDENREMTGDDVKIGMIGGMTGIGGEEQNTMTESGAAEPGAGVVLQAVRESFGGNSDPVQSHGMVSDLTTSLSSFTDTGHTELGVWSL